MPEDRRPLPVLKVLYRNTSRLQARGGDDVLRPVEPAATLSTSPADVLRDAVHRRDATVAERTLAALAKDSPNRAFNDLLQTVEEAPEVHRIVLAYRAWDMLNLVGRDYAETMLRQSLRFCLRGEETAARHFGAARTLLPKLLDQYHLADRKPGERRADDSWLEAMSQTIFTGTPEQAADAAAAALAEGMAPESIAEAVSLAANQLVLRDEGRRAGEAQPNKPQGSVHGDSIGVHACDSAHAWRNIARVSNNRNCMASLVLSAYQVAHDRTRRGGNFLEWKPRPYQEQLERVSSLEPETLLRHLDGAIREQDQGLACALVHRYGEQGHQPEPVFQLLLRYAISEDGALHAEKYYATVRDEFAATRPAFRWRQLVALARVTASEYGQPADGYDEACRLLNVSATASK